MISQEAREGRQKEARQEEVGQEERGVQQEEAMQAERQMDECVENVRCKGNCEHVQCHTNIEHQASLEVTCYNCKNKFKDKMTMMDHKRDSVHQSKRKCNQSLTVREGWYRHVARAGVTSSRPKTWHPSHIVYMGQSPVVGLQQQMNQMVNQLSQVMTKLGLTPQ